MQLSLLQQLWNVAWHEISHKPAPQQGFSHLIALYSEKHRKYHTIQHLYECLLQAEQVKHLAAHYGEIIIALWFHDAIYDTHKLDNEEQSANLAQHYLEAQLVPQENIQRIYDLILTTKHSCTTKSTDEALLVDIDLSILGAALSRFYEYEKQIREEYCFVPEKIFNGKRVEILQRFLDQQRIYRTDHFFCSHEKQARINLSYAIERINAGKDAN